MVSDADLIQKFMSLTLEQQREIIAQLACNKVPAPPVAVLDISA